MQEKVSLNRDHEMTLIMLVWNSVKLKMFISMQTGWPRMHKLVVQEKCVILSKRGKTLQRLYKKSEVKWIN